MNIKKKILAISIGPVLVLGIISLAFSVTMVKNSMLDEVKDALKGTAAATLAAYDQNTGDYMETSNGDIWKGSYNICSADVNVEMSIAYLIWKGSYSYLPNGCHLFLRG